MAGTAVSQYELTFDPFDRIPSPRASRFSSYFIYLDIILARIAGACMALD